MSSPPSTLGQYQIIREIARSNDIVYEAYDPLMNRRVAIKELMMPPGSTPQQREDRISRFKREAQAAGTLNHASIMTVYSFAEDAGHTFMAMEFLDGQTLRNELDARGGLSVDRALEITRAVLAGLEHAHSKGVIHRDIKPDNIQILSNGQIKITDFGIARLTFQPNLTVDGQVFGTPSYMSPEQVVGRDIDARSDIFSVGVMLYEMLTGQKPFSGDSVVSTTYAIMNKEPDQPASIYWPLWSVISRSLEKSPAMRWASAKDMMEALDDAADPTRGAMPLVDPSVPAGYHPSTNPYAAPPPAPPVAGMYGGPVFDPYAIGAQGSPYAGQYGQPQAPLTFPYNPYQGPGGAYAPHTPGMPPPGNAPVYYPPPPRQPLIKPDQILFLKKVSIAILLIGTLFALIVVGVQALFNEINKITQQQAQIQKDQKAVETTLEAQKEIQNDRVPEGELILSQQIEKDPTNAVLRENRGSLYFSKAANLPPPEALTLYEQSAADYEQAVTNQADPQKRQNDSEMFARAAYQFAYNASQTPGLGQLEIRKARQQLETAGARVQTLDPQLYQDINELVSKLR